MNAGISSVGFGNTSAKVGVDNARPQATIRNIGTQSAQFTLKIEVVDTEDANASNFSQTVTSSTISPGSSWSHTGSWTPSTSHEYAVIATVYDKSGNDLLGSSSYPNAKAASQTFEGPKGSVKVTLSPSDAINAGARWKLDNGSWQSSGTLLSNIAAGDHTIHFESVDGWITPSSKSVTIQNGQQSTETGVYQEVVEKLIFNITNVDGSALPSGRYTVQLWDASTNTYVTDQSSMTSQVVFDGGFQAGTQYKYHIFFNDMQSGGNELWAVSTVQPAYGQDTVVNRQRFMPWVIGAVNPGTVQTTTTPTVQVTAKSSTTAVSGYLKLTVEGHSAVQIPIQTPNMGEKTYDVTLPELSQTGRLDLKYQIYYTKSSQPNQGTWQTDQGMWSDFLNVVEYSDEFSIESVPADANVPNAVQYQPVTLALKINDPGARINKVEWTLSDGTIVDPQPGAMGQYVRSLTHSFAAAGNYQATATVFDGSNNQLYSTTFNIVVSEGAVVGGEHTTFIDNEPGHVSMVTSYANTNAVLPANYPFIKWESEGDFVVTGLDIVTELAISQSKGRKLAARMIAPKELDNHLFTVGSLYEVAPSVKVMLPVVNNEPVEGQAMNIMDALASHDERVKSYSRLITDMVHLRQYKSNIAYQQKILSDFDMGRIDKELSAMGYAGGIYNKYAQYLNDLVQKAEVGHVDGKIPTIVGIGAFQASFLSAIEKGTPGQAAGAIAVVGDLAGLFMSLAADAVDAREKEFADFLMSFMLRQGEVERRLSWLKREVSPLLKDSAFDYALSEVGRIAYDPGEGYFWKALFSAREKWEYGQQLGVLTADIVALVTASAKGLVGPAMLLVDSIIISVDGIVDYWAWNENFGNWEIDQALSTNLNYFLGQVKSKYLQELYSANTPIVSDYSNYKDALTLSMFLALRDVKAGTEAIEGATNNDGIVMTFAKYCAVNFGNNSAAEYLEWAGPQADFYADELIRAYEYDYLANNVIAPVSTVTITNSEPSLNFTASHTVTANQDIEVSIATSDPNPLDELRLTVVGLPEGALYDSLTKQIIWTPSSADVGTHRISVSVSDGLHSVEKELTIIVQAPPAQSPSVSITSPSGSASIEYPATSYAVSGTASDPDGSVAQVQYRVNGGSWQTASGSSNWNFTAMNLNVGQNLIEVRASDNENYASSVASVVVTRKSEETPPPCSFSISPASHNFPASGGTISVNVDTSSGMCGWAVSENTPWISSVSPRSGVGDQTVSISVDKNTDTNSRSATLTIGGSSLSISQDAAATKALTKVEIIAPTSLVSGESATLVAQAVWSDGTSSSITPSWSENSSHCTISGNEISVSSDGGGNSVTITAQFTYQGVTKSSSITILIQGGAVSDQVTASFTSITKTPYKTWIFGAETSIGTEVSAPLAANISDYEVPWCTGWSCCDNDEYSSVAISRSTVKIDQAYKVRFTGKPWGGVLGPMPACNSPMVGS